MGLIGNKPNQTPTNADLGTMAYEDADYFRGNTEIDTLGTVTTGDIKNSALARAGRATIRPSLLLDFAKSKTLDPRITFTRGGIGTYTDANGLIKNAASNEARFDHNPITGESLGLLIEEQRTNLLTYSENFDNAAWAKVGTCTISSNTTTAPDGALTADTLNLPTIADRINPPSPTATAVSTTYTGSIWLAGSGTIELSLANGNGTYAITTTEITLTPILTRYTVSHTTSATTTSIYYILGRYNGTGTATSVIAWGAQLEQGAFATSYIPSADSFTSRASTGTFIGSNGLIQSAATNVARYNYNPLNLALSPKLLLEPAATNLLTYSEQFDNAAWTKAANTGISANVLVSPDGTTTADKLTETTTTNAGRSIYQAQAVASGATLTHSVYAKAGERSWVRVDIWDGTGNTASANFNLSTGEAGSNGTAGSGITFSSTSITPVGNGWYRCLVTATTTGITYIYGRIQLLNADNNATYIGIVGNGLYIWGAQLEVGTTATSYIPTTSAQVTRSADVSSSSAATRPADNAVITGTNFSSWYRQDEGTLALTAKIPVTLGANGFGQLAQLDNTIFGTRLCLFVNPYKSTGLYFENANIVQADAYKQYTESLTTRQAIGYKANDIAYSNGNDIIYTDTSATIPTFTNLKIGMGTYNNIVGVRTISKIAYYPKRLSNTELQGLTTT
jgi:hypothetical protein